jgi:aminopeptidase
VEDELLGRLADLALDVGSNLQRGQTLTVAADLEHTPFIRVLADRAYRRGARFVDIQLFDPWIKRARIEHAAEETLDFVPSWYGLRALERGEQRCASVSVTGPSAPSLLADLDPERAGKDQLPRVKESLQVMSDRTVNWTIVPYATAAWAAQVHPDLDAPAALQRLEEQLVYVCRLDAADPVAAWRERLDETERAAARLNELGLDRVCFEGPGTDLTIGLLPTSRWLNARFETVDGLRHLANVPSEEVFTSPDPERADGVVRATKPLSFPDGTVVRGLRVRFEGGRAVEIEADEGAGVLRQRAARDEGAARLGEVALVDRSGRVGELDTIFWETLLDENAASHIALGAGFDFAVGDEDRGRRNQSALHIDFMIGGDDVDVTGVTRAGDRVPLLRGGDWQI